jgi:hypothetical protein
MNQPTREEFERLEADQKQLREEVRKLRDQITEEIKTVKVEVSSADVQIRLDNHTGLLEEISQKQDTQEKQLSSISTDIDEIKLDGKAYIGDAAIFKNKVERVELDVSTIKEDVGTLKSDVSILKTDMEQVKTVQSGHSKFFEEHGRRLSQIEADVTSIKSTQTEQSELLRQILAKL